MTCRNTARGVCLHRLLSPAPLFWRSVAGGIFSCATLLALPSVAHAALSVETARVGHGVKVWYAASASVPVVDIQLSFAGAGYASDPEGKEGRAVLAAALLTQGAGAYDAVAFQHALEEGAIELSATAEEDRLLIHLHALRDQAPKAGELLALALKSPRFSFEDMAREKTALAVLLARAKEDAGYQAQRMAAERAFTNHPYANPPYGTREGLNAVTAQDLRDYLSSFAARGNVQIAAAGDVDDALLDRVLSPVVEALRDGDRQPPVAPVTLQGMGEILHTTLPVPQTNVVFFAPGITRDDPRFYAAYLLNYILGGDGLSSRLSQAVRQEKGLVYGIGSSLDVREGVALLSGGFATRNATRDQAIAATKGVLEGLRSRGVSTQECDDARTYVMGSFALAMDSSDDVASTLLMMQRFNLGENYLTERQAFFENVTCSAINDLAKELLNPENFLFATAGGAR